MKKLLLPMLITAAFALASRAGDVKEAPKDHAVEPVPPLELSEEVLSIMDMEVDSFIKVNEAREELKVSGNGLCVAVIDSGLNIVHKDFLGKVIARVNFTENTGGKEDVTDRIGHGSNVASIIAGHSPLKGGLHTGIAPDATIIPLKVFTGIKLNPGGKFSQINAALQWVIENHAAYRISVVNMSLGNPENLRAIDPGWPDEFKLQREKIQALRALNVAVVVSAGNYYHSHGHQEGMSFPAVCPETISVGAIFDTDIELDSPIVYESGAIVKRTLAGRCTPFSQRLGETVGKECQTDIFAPGYAVTGAGKSMFYLNGDKAGQVDVAASRTSNSLQDGTSQAAPVVAGLVLLMQEYYLKLTRGSDLPPVDLLEKALRESGPVFFDEEDQQAKDMDNVISSGATFHYALAPAALNYLKSQSQINVQQLRAELGSVKAKLLGAKSQAEKKAVLDQAKALNLKVLELKETLGKESSLQLLMRQKQSF